MTNEALLAELARQNVLLRKDGDRLNVRAAKGVLTSELRTELAERKEDVLAALRERIRQGQAELPQILPHPGERCQPFPLTDIQRAYVLGRTDAFELGNTSCYVYYEVESTKLDLDRFNSALRLLIDRHDMLRAIVRPDGQQQVLEKVAAYQIEVLDLRGVDNKEAESKLQAIRERMSTQVFPHDRWPLFEIRASQLDDELIRIHLCFDILIVDVWSLQILFKEWRQVYQDPNAVLGELRMTFRDYVLAGLELRKTEAYRRSLDYWSKRWASLPPGPELPLSIKPEMVTQPRFTRRRGRLEAESWSRLKKRARDSNLTPSGLLLSVFAEVLKAWSKCPRFAINVTLSNRLPLHAQVDKIVGDFTSVIPLEVDNSFQGSFEATARRIQSRLLDDMEHRFVGGVQIMREAARTQGKESGFTSPVVFTSLLSHNMGGGGSLSKTLWMGETIYGISQTPQVWLDHQVAEDLGALVFNWDAVEDLFPQGLLQDMFDAYCLLLDRLARDEQSWHAQLRQVVPALQLEQRVLANATESEVPEALLHSMFSVNAQLHPDHTALVCGSRRLSYKELDRLSNQVGRRLRVLGARPGHLVAVVMEKGWEQVVAVVGALKSGAAYLPINPRLPRERFWRLLENGECDVVVTQAHLDRELEWPQSVKRIVMDETARGSLYDEPLEPVQTPQDTAYVIYTSGSTGTPKGVIVDHRGALNTIIDVNRRFSIGTYDKVLALSDLSFDLSVYDIFGALSAGATIVVPDGDAARDPAQWLQLISQEQVTVWNSVPALMQMLVAYASGADGQLPPSLRLALLSGDWIPVTLPGQIKALAPGIQLIGLGGATEASIWSIHYPIEQVDPAWKSIPYGRPLQNQRLHVLSDDLEACPVWAPGQLYIGGVGLARGYWREEEKTREAFITHPATGERLYRTGDLGRYLPSGDIEFLGREDSQVKVQGYRIELGEIESALERHPSVRAAAVKVIGEAQESKRLIAYVVATAESPTTAELASFLKGKLPSYMAPSTFVTVAALPLTANGKVDRKSLPDPPRSSSRPRRGVTGDRAAIEARISAIVAAVLRVAHIEAEADFFELGATSLEIVLIRGQLEKELMFPQKLEDVFRFSTVAAVAKAYEQHFGQV